MLLIIRFSLSRVIRLEDRINKSITNPVIFVIKPSYRLLHASVPPQGTLQEFQLFTAQSFVSFLSSSIKIEEVKAYK